MRLYKVNILNKVNLRGCLYQINMCNVFCPSQRNVMSSGVIPQISLIMGPCAGNPKICSYYNLLIKEINPRELTSEILFIHCVIIKAGKYPFFNPCLNITKLGDIECY